MKSSFLFAGKAILTVEASEASQKSHGHRPHYTYKVERATRPGTFFVSFMTGSENTKSSSYRYMCMLDTEFNVRFTNGSKFKPDSREARVFARAIAAIQAGKDGLEMVERSGWKLHHAGFCGRCAKLLTNPASIETGIGPECELFVRLGIEPCDVPCTDPRGAEVARLQLAYWMNGDDGVILHAIADAAEEAFGWDRERAELYADCTKYLMRKHKKGKKLSAQFFAIANRM